MAKTVREMIEVMEAFEKGEPIECKLFPHVDKDSWVLLLDEPSWDWSAVDYRVAATPDSIDWSHVSSEYKYMARDKSGDVFLYSKRPELGEFIWEPHKSIACCLQTDYWADDSQVNPFSSYKKGTIRWDESLVERPS